jgi:hypothetical protein
MEFALPRRERKKLARFSKQLFLRDPVGEAWLWAAYHGRFLNLEETLHAAVEGHVS